MKMKPSELLEIEGVLIEELKTKAEPSLPSIPLKENLSVSYSLLKADDATDTYAVRMRVKTIKKTQLQFDATVMLIFKLLKPKLSEQERKLILPTMVSMSYSTLRGILIRELPMIDLRNRILPPVDLPVLLKAREKKTRKKKTPEDKS